MSRRYKGGFITATPPTNSSTSASGVWTSRQQMQALAGSAWPVPAPTTIGQVYGGGYYAGQIGVSGTATYYIVVAPYSSGQNNSVLFQTGPGYNAGAESNIDGPSNSASMNDSAHPAAQFCEGLTIGGFTDWYSPAVNELEVCYYNLKPSTVSNNTSSGINPNSVPARASNYTSGTPTRTSATLFQAGQSQAFDEVRYWTSTQDTSIGNRARFQTFYTGQQGNYYKPSYMKVRAIRRVAV